MKARWILVIVALTLLPALARAEDWPRLSEVRVGYDTGYASSDLGARLQRVTGSGYGLESDIYVVDKPTDVRPIYGLSFGFQVGGIDQERERGLGVQWASIRADAIGGATLRVPVGFLTLRGGYSWQGEFAVHEASKDDLINLSHHGVVVKARLDHDKLSEEIQLAGLLSSGYQASVAVRWMAWSPFVIGVEARRLSTLIREEPDRDREANHVFLFLAWAFAFTN